MSVEIDNKGIILSRNDYMAKKVVFVDGQAGCGKSLVSSIISAMSYVELLSYLPEVENICVLNFFNKIQNDAADVMIGIQTDLKIYQTMMGRDVNFRISDVSSAINNHDTKRYVERIYGPGDEQIQHIIEEESPILNISSHNLFPFSEPIWRKLGKRCSFIKIVRHPLYLVRQMFLNVKNITGTARNFAIYFDYDGIELPHFAYGIEDRYMQSNNMEKAVYSIYNFAKLAETATIASKQERNILNIPFERFVLNPDPWMEKIAKVIGSSLTDATRQVMKEQNVPRDMIAQGIDLDIYRRCGWVPPKDGSTEREELNIRREEVAREVSSEVLSVLDRLSGEYENKYWNPDVPTAI